MWDSFVIGYVKWDMFQTFSFWFGAIGSFAAFLAIISFFIKTIFSFFLKKGNQENPGKRNKIIHQGVSAKTHAEALAEIINLKKQLAEISSNATNKAPESTSKIKEFNIQFDKGDTGEALKILASMLNIPDIKNKIETDILFMEALTYQKAKQYQKAIDKYTELHKLEPKNTNAYINRGAVYYELGQYEKAIADFDKAISLDGNDAAAYGNLAELYFLIDDNKKAKQTLSRAFKIKELGKDDKLVFHFMEYLFLDKAKLALIKSLLKDNIYHETNDLSELVEKACQNKDHNCEFINALADVINKKADIKTLNEFPEWRE